jgi:hypothetical protein
VLADLHLESPLLHIGLEVTNPEGLVDIFLYGASLARIAKPVRDGAFYLIPAGTYAPDAGEIHRHPRWRKLIAGFRDTNASLLLFAPGDVATVSALSSWASEAVLLGPPADASVPEVLREAGVSMLAVLEPPLLAPSPQPEAPAGAGAGGLPAAPEPPRERAAPAPAAVSSAKPDLELPPPPTRRKPARRGVSALLWLIFVLVLLGTALYLVATLRPDLIPGLGGSPVAPPGAGDPAPAREGQASSRLGELLPYSIQVRAFTSLAAAREELAAEQRRLASVPFFISPEEIQGILYYKILAGLSTDTVEAKRLRERLVQVGAVESEEAVGAWSLLQFTPLAFDVGDFGTHEEATEWSDSLLVRQVPTYSVAVPYSDGSRRWQLYGGAYRDSSSASRMREMLVTAGIEPRLTARTGLPAAGVP